MEVEARLSSLAQPPLGVGRPLLRDPQLRIELAPRLLRRLGRLAPRHRRRLPVESGGTLHFGAA